MATCCVNDVNDVTSPDVYMSQFTHGVTVTSLLFAMFTAAMLEEYYVAAV